MILSNEMISKKSTLMIAQITDSHLFSSKSAMHYGYNVYENLKKVLINISHNPKINIIFFTGDLTQDHTEQSYQNFVDCIVECNISLPIYFIAGNHDEPKIMKQYFSTAPFVVEKTLSLLHWQIQLIDSKSDSPAGYVSEEALEQLSTNINKDKHQLLMMHHHPIDVGYFIDKHGLQNKNTFWQSINRYDNLKGIACGHVHRAMELKTPYNNSSLMLFTCPATSIQFDPEAQGVEALIQGPGYRLFNLYPNGEIDSDVVML